MFAVNHALSGAVIGLSISNPVIAVPLAFGSHFLLDAVPHYGSNETQHELLNSRHFQRRLVVEAVLCFLIVVILCALQPKNWITASMCAFFAVSPDLFWIGKFIRTRKGRVATSRPNVFLRFHHWIQWYEKPLGILSEAAAFVILAAVVLSFL